MKLEYSVAFDAKVPEDPSSREDDHLVLEEKRIFAVFDGMGGIGASDAQFSSRSTKEEVTAYIDIFPPHLKGDKYLEMMKTGIKLANEKLMKRAQKEHHNLGTTLSLVHFFEEGKKKFMHFFIVGDSPISIYRKDAKVLKQVKLVDNYFLQQIINREVVDEENALKIDDYEIDIPVQIDFSVHPIQVLINLDQFYEKQGYPSFLHFLMKHQEELQWTKKEELTQEAWDLTVRYHKESEQAGVHLTHINTLPHTSETEEEFMEEIHNDMDKLLKLFHFFHGYGFYHNEIESLLKKHLPIEKNTKLIDRILKTIIDFYFSKRNVLGNCIGLPEMTVHSGTVEVFAGDMVLIESDGTSDVLTNQEKENLIESQELNDVSQAIVNAAKTKQAKIDAGDRKSIRGKYCDDKTVVVVQVS